MAGGMRKLVKAERLLVQEVGEEMVILDLDSEQYFALDQVGLRFWQLLDEEPSLEALVDRLGQEYAVERERLAADMERFVARLLEQGLVREDGPG